MPDYTEPIYSLPYYFTIWRNLRCRNTSSGGLWEIALWNLFKKNRKSVLRDWKMGYSTFWLGIISTISITLILANVIWHYHCAPADDNNSPGKLSSISLAWTKKSFLFCFCRLEMMDSLVFHHLSPLCSHCIEIWNGGHTHAIHMCPDAAHPSQPIRIWT